MNRGQMFFLGVSIVLLSPILLFVLLFDILVGADRRARAMLIAFDQVGNAATGGSPTMTVSERTGNALLAGKPWAKPAAKFIDYMFGKNHCLENATINRTH